MPRSCWLLAFALIVPAFSRADEPGRSVIDREVSAAWKAQKLTPAAKSSDAEFLRRVSIDLVGVPPTHDETNKFLADTDAKKREKLIDKLLADPRFAEAQAIGCLAMRRAIPLPEASSTCGSLNGVLIWTRHSFGGCYAALRPEKARRSISCVSHNVSAGHARCRLH
jgi:hypothetical protein